MPCSDPENEPDQVLAMFKALLPNRLVIAILTINLSSSLEL